MVQLDAQAAEAIEIVKTEVNPRGVGRAAAHVYVDFLDENAQVIVCVTDFFEGEEVLVVGAEDGKAITGSETQVCGGKIADSTAVLCKKEVTFPFDISKEYAFTITYGGVAQKCDISSKLLSASLRWGE